MKRYVVAALIILPIVLAVGWYGATQTAHASLESALSEVRAAGIPTTREELEATLSPLTPEDEQARPALAFFLALADLHLPLLQDFMTAIPLKTDLVEFFSKLKKTLAVRDTFKLIIQIILN